VKYVLRISSRATRDVAGVLDYTLERFGDRQHDQYAELIREALAAIAADPGRPPARRRPEIRHDARTYHLARRGKPARHFFLYRVLPNNEVEIGRLLHDSMDLSRHLPEGYEAEG
jgi:toxin ParE1/3/4